MNYRSAVVIGEPRRVDDLEERLRALDLIVDHMVPGRAATSPRTRKELAATAVLAFPLHEASMKQREGGAGAEPGDLAAGTWAGHVPVRRVASPPVPDADARGAVPAEVVARATALRPGGGRRIGSRP